MRIRVLGPIEVYDGEGTAVPLRRAKARALLAALTIDLNRQVGRDTLIDALWGERPPVGADTTLLSYVSQLRRAVGGGSPSGSPLRLMSGAGGYRLETDPELVDAGRFERLAAEGAAGVRAGAMVEAEQLLGEALSLCRGRPYAEFADQPFARAASERLGEARLAALEDHVEATLGLGRHSSAVAQLEELVANHPLRERLYGLLMRALYRSGRQAEALAAYGRLRVRLAEELGIDPSPELRELERAILQQRPELGGPAPPPAPPTRSATAGRPPTDTPDVLPTTRFARSGDVHIAYQVVGDGPVDLVFVPGMMNHLELMWEAGTEAERFFRHLASFSRLILFDKRGTGLSDRDVGRPSLEQRMDDLRAVMDEAGSERAALIGFSEGGPLSILFATTYPERVASLVLASTMARVVPAPDYQCGQQIESFIEAFRRLVDDGWGQGDSIEWFAPNLAHIRAARANVARWERLAVSPGSLATYLALFPLIDVRALLPAIRVPTLVIHRSDDIIVEPCHARYLADHIAGARLVERPGGNHILWSDAGTLADEIEAFVSTAPADIDTDRVLTTVLFTDIVGSTERAGAVGDRRWRELLDRHDELGRRLISRFRGNLVKTTGDGLLATFDGPARAIRCAQALGEALRSHDLEIRAGVHTGEVERRGDDVGGIAVHIGQRVAALATPGQVLVSGTVHDLVIGSGLEFEPKGSKALRGVPGKWRLFAVLR